MGGFKRRDWCRRSHVPAEVNGWRNEVLSGAHFWGGRQSARFEMLRQQLLQIRSSGYSPIRPRLLETRRR
ncbi:MAG: hypothetical protein CM15mP103_06270 [Gammaproteobacteria bacterium]|nr:MAG: hypothetical protein CM15mP103_06270 [Gammaproteobacteria bacterium]